MSEEATLPATRPKKRHLKLYITLGVAGLLLATALGFFLYLTQSPDLNEYSDAVGMEERGANTLVYATLASAGYEDLFVSVKPTYIYVGYELPRNNSTGQAMDASEAQYFVLGASAPVAPGNGQVVAVQFVDAKPKLSWTVSTNDLVAHLEGRLSASDLEAKITKTPL
jgi:hypothetical protein